MPINYKKIVVTADELAFEPGTILGLATGQINQRRDHLKQLKNGAELLKNQFEVTVRVLFGKGTALWVDERCLPANGDGSFKLVPMLKSYQELLTPTPNFGSMTLGGRPALTY